MPTWSEGISLLLLYVAAGLSQRLSSRFPSGILSVSRPLLVFHMFSLPSNYRKILRDSSVPSESLRYLFSLFRIFPAVVTAAF